MKEKFRCSKSQEITSENFFEALERQHEPETVIKDYEDTHALLLEIVACLEPGVVKEFWQVMEDSYPGYDLGRKRTGALLPGHVVAGYLQGLRYDDELMVDWSASTT